MSTIFFFLISMFCLQTTVSGLGRRNYESRSTYKATVEEPPYNPFQIVIESTTPQVSNYEKETPNPEEYVPEELPEAFPPDIPSDISIEGLLQALEKSTIPQFIGADGTVDPRADRTKSPRPTMSTSAIKLPLMPRLDINNTEPCDIIAYFCLKSYKTGKICGRASSFVYRTFETYCNLDYINCKERTNVWKIAYMGRCIPKPELIVTRQPPQIYDYHDDYFLDDTFVIDESFNEFIDNLEPIHVPLG